MSLPLSLTMNMFSVCFFRSLSLTLSELSPFLFASGISTFPNPFNPVTTVKFTAAIGSRGTVKVYNLRGELVRTLHAGEFQTQEFTWDGTDARGASVASGVYVIQARNEGKNFNAKVALVK